VAVEVFPAEPELEPPMIPLEPPPEPLSTAITVAELERQSQLADQLRALVEARASTERRAAEVTADLKTEADSERGMLTASRGGLLADLRDPASLRRAFVLREVLGPPLGLR